MRGCDAPWWAFALPQALKISREKNENGTTDSSDCTDEQERLLVIRAIRVIGVVRGL
jgi:hypothetical protein